MATALSQCGTCAVQFTRNDFVVGGDPLIISTCYHIFHQACLKPWINEPTKPCPLCKQPIHFQQAGKDEKTIAEVILIAIKSYPQIMTHSLDKSDPGNCVCAICRTGHVCPAGDCSDCEAEPKLKQHLPLVPVRWDAKKKQLFHDNDICGAGLANLTVQGLADIAKEVAKVDKKVRDSLTPTPPSFLQKALREFRLAKKEHPYAFRFIAVELTSIAALMINRSRFEGESWLLYGLSLPALISLTVVHQVARVIIAVLNTHQPN